MDIGAAGQLILFFSTLVAFILLSLFVFSYAAHSFLVVLINSAAGNDEVIWPGEPLADWFLKGFYLGWIVAVWAVPASLLAGALHVPAPVTATVFGGVIWLAFPVSVLSSLSASSRWVIWRPAIATLLLQHSGLTVGFYVRSGLIVAACTALVFEGVFGSALGFALLPVAAGVTAIGMLLYARLLGRVGLVISRRGTKKARKRSDARPEESELVETFDPWSTPAPEPEPEKPARHAAPPRKKTARPKRRADAYDPWSVAPDEAVPEPPAATPKPDDDDPLGPARGSYGLSSDEAVQAPAPNVPLASAPEEGYALAHLPEGNNPKALVAALSEPSEEEMKLQAPRRLPPIPARPLGDRIWGFPFYPHSLGPLATLAGGFLGVGVLARLVLAQLPNR